MSVDNTSVIMMEDVVMVDESSIKTTSVSTDHQQQHPPHKRPCQQLVVPVGPSGEQKMATPSSYEHLDKRPRWNTLPSSLSIDSNLSTKTEASLQQAQPIVDDDENDNDATTAPTNMDAMILVESLVDQMENWSLMNLKEWRRQESMSSDGSSSTPCPTLKKKFRMAKRDMLRMMRNPYQTTNTATSSMNGEDGDSPLGV